MKSINYLQFPGNATEALNYYQNLLPNVTVKKVTFAAMGDNPNLPLTSDEKNMIMEAQLEFLDNVLMLSDVPPFMSDMIGELINGNRLIISLIDGDPAINKIIFDKLATEGTLIMPLSEVPWSINFGMLIDKFGITWKFNSSATTFLQNF